MSARKKVGPDFDFRNFVREFEDAYDKALKELPGDLRALIPG